jgi:hypothetical protein
MRVALVLRSECVPYKQVKADHGQPLSYSLVPRAQMTSRAASWKQVWTGPPAPLEKVVVDRLARLLRDLEASGPSRFALANGCSIDRISVVRYVNDL